MGSCFGSSDDDDDDDGWKRRCTFACLYSSVDAALMVIMMQLSLVWL